LALLRAFDKLLKLDWYFSVFSRHSRDIGSISILMTALFLRMQIEARKLDPLRFTGSAADRVSVKPTQPRRGKKAGRKL
jgi:hypothetical protein